MRRALIIDANTYSFAGRTVSKSSVDHYVKNVVARLRGVMKAPGLIDLLGPRVVYDLECQRRELHTLLLEEAGFTEEQIDHREDDPDVEAFNAALGAFLDAKAPLI